MYVEVLLYRNERSPHHNPHHFLVPVEAAEPPRQVPNRRRAEGVQ